MILENMTPHVKESESKQALEELVEELVRRIDELQSMISEAEAHLASHVREFLLGAGSDDETLARAAYVYWNLPRIPVGLIAECVPGKDTRRHAARLLGMLPKGAGPSNTCEMCGASFLVRSRNEIEWQRLGWRSTVLCDSCRATKHGTGL